MARQATGSGLILPNHRATWSSSKVYIGNSEFGYNHSGVNLYQRTIIHAPTGACAVFQDSAGVNSIYYVHTDYLGSWLAITNNNTKVAVVDTYSYDAWGRPRTSKTWKLLNIPVTNSLASINNCQPRFDHGYTGHEHLPGFGLINCNARLYDPYSQRFMSPDRDIKDPTNAQNLYNIISPLLLTFQALTRLALKTIQNT